MSLLVQVSLRFRLRYVFQIKFDSLSLPFCFFFQALQKQMEDLVTHENIMLQTLGFDIMIKHPHPLVVEGCEKIRGTSNLQCAVPSCS